MHQCGVQMLVGYDGWVVGAWASTSAAYRGVVDLGTGTGRSALMLARRLPGARIVGVDIDTVEQARENAAASPWGDRLTFRTFAFPAFHDGPFVFIVPNPPFFVDSLTGPDAGRTAARHAVHLTFGELRDAVLRLLTPAGRFALILPVQEAGRFLAVCAGQLQPVRRTDVRTTPRHPAKRSLLELMRPEAAAAAGFERTELIIGTGEHECYTPEYRALTRDFYLKF